MTSEQLERAYRTLEEAREETLKEIARAGENGTAFRSVAHASVLNSLCNAMREVDQLLNPFVPSCSDSVDTESEQARALVEETNTSTGVPELSEAQQRMANVRAAKRSK